MRILISIYILLCLLVLPTEAAKFNPTSQPLELQTLLTMNGHALGSVLITIDTDDSISLDSKQTLELLSQSLSGDIINQLKGESNQGRLTPDDFKRQGVELVFNPELFEMQLTMQKAQQKEHALSAIMKQPNRKYQADAKLSGYLNSRAALEHDEYENQQASDSNLTQYYQFESGISWKKNFLTSEFTLDDEDGGNWQFKRIGTRLSRDFADSATRITLGDFYQSSVGFQDGTDIIGLSISRDYSDIPTRNVRPTASQRFTLQRTSNVDVKVDGIIINRLTLAPGSYNLQDIPLAAGNNNVELVISDNYGNSETLNFNIATGRDLLKEGEYEYSLGFGVPGNLSNQGMEYENQHRVISGFYEYGLNPWLTLGVNGQWLISRDSTKKTDIQQLGQRTLVATSIGTFETNIAYSDHDYYHSGWAASIGFDAEFPASDQFNPSLSIKYEYFSPNFVGINSIISDTDAGEFNDPSDLIALQSDQHAVTLYFDSNITSTLRGSLSGVYTYSYDNDYRWSLSSGLSAPLFSTAATWNLTATYQYEKRTDDDDLSLQAIVSWPLGYTGRWISSYNSYNQQAQSELSYKKNLGNTGGISTFIGVENSKDTDAAIDAGFYYTGNRFEFNADHTTRYVDLTDTDRSHVSRVEVAASVAFADNQWAIGRPVNESFAIIKPHANLKEHYVEIQPNDDTARVNSDNLGAMLIPDLVAYSEQQINYDVEDLPPGYSLGEGAFALYPENGSGYALTIGSDDVITVMGVFEYSNKQPLSLAVGSATLRNNTQYIPIEFFTNRNGQFAISGLREGRYIIRFAKQNLYYDLHIKENSPLLINLGTISLNKQN
ncbi:TPA: fimbria/pilus outer membrane usher protein [Photobacterium damselae]